MAEEKTVYAQINRKVWTTCQFRGISREARELFFYLTTCPHGNMLGMFVLRPGYALDDLQWGSDRELFMKPFAELLDKGLFKYDPKAEIVLDMEQIIKHPPVNGNMITAAIKIINALPKTPLFKDLKILVESLSKPYCKPLAERLAERYGNPVTVTVTVTDNKKHATAPVDNFTMPSKEEIENFSKPLLQAKIESAVEELYSKHIFTEALIFTNKALKADRNPQAILHTLVQCIEKRPRNPWGYCEQIIKLEDLNYNERDHIRAAQ